MSLQDALELYGKMQKSPLFFIQQMWGLVPERDNAKFIKGKHITWQQEDLLLAVENAISGNKPTRITVKSGHGTGKTSTIAWLILWYLFCFKDSQIPCTAPTADQMFDVLWKELAKWHALMPSDIRDKYEWSTSYLRFLESPNTWFARAKTARKEAPEALAGVHGDYVMFIIDEASGVPEEIFNTAEGALTNKNILVIMVSNPTRLIGYFYDSHHKDKDAWQVLHFNSEKSPIVDNTYMDRIASKHGKDSDEYRIRVLGEFPQEDSVDSKGYVPLLVQGDLHKTFDFRMFGNKRLGVDPSGEGSDVTSWVLRDKFKAMIVAQEKVSTTQSIAQKTLTLMQQFDVKGSNVFLDNFGIGANIAQEMALTGTRITAVNVGEQARDATRYINKRAEAYWNLRVWLKSGGELIESEEWLELLGIRYRAELSGKLKIMSKREMKDVGIASPNFADALMLTFCTPEIATIQRASQPTQLPNRGVYNSSSPY